MVDKNDYATGKACISSPQNLIFSLASVDHYTINGGKGPSVEIRGCVEFLQKTLNSYGERSYVDFVPKDTRLCRPKLPARSVFAADHKKDPHVLQAYATITATNNHITNP